MPYKNDSRKNHRQYLSGAKRLNGIDRYNPIIDDWGVYTHNDIMKFIDDRHRKLFPEKYNEDGIRVDFD